MGASEYVLDVNNALRYDPCIVRLRVFSLLFFLLFAFQAMALRPTLRLSQGFPEHLRIQMKTDLQKLIEIQGSQSTPLHDKIFGGGIDGELYAKFFQRRVSFVSYRASLSSIFIAAFIPSTREMVVSNKSLNVPWVLRMGVLIHEARHADGYGHAKCPSPYLDENGEAIRSTWTGATLQGKALCDRTAVGSYGTEIVFYRNIERYCTNCTVEDSKVAGQEADRLMLRIISPNGKKELEDDLNSAM